MVLNFQSLARETANLQQHHRDVLRQANLRVKCAHEKAESVSSAVGQLELNHRDQLGSAHALADRRLELTQARYVRMVEEVEARTRVLREERQQMEEHAQSARQEGERLRHEEEGTRRQLEERLAAVDAQEEKTLQSAGNEASTVTARSDKGAQDFHGRLKGDCHRAWSSDDTWRDALEGARSARRDRHFRPAPLVKQLPFGQGEWPFDGFGTHFGRQVAKPQPQGFRQETALRLLQKKQPQQQQQQQQQRQQRQQPQQVLHMH
mmetsp:Transcript_74495/g.147545  ORF Transcript_74495/g.147545 Transcript_74495/m.147545 type:complete len:264 (-) Transcript_74495:64-855(-)